MTGSSADDQMRAMAERLRAAAGTRRLNRVNSLSSGSIGGRHLFAPPPDPRDLPGAVAVLEERPDSLAIPSVGRTEPIDSNAGPSGSAFDGLFEAVSGRVTWGPHHPQPPASRFRLPVAVVGRPHRSTKRDYDYFEDLNRALEAQRAQEGNSQN